MSGTPYSGRKVKVGLGREVTRGTAVSAAYWVRWETFDFFDTATTIFNQSALGVLDKYSQAEVVEAWAEGSLAGKVTDQSIGEILYATFGSHSAALHATETAVWDHTFTESQANAAQTLTIVRSDPNQALNYANGMVKSFELDVKAGDFVRHTTQFMSQPGASTTATPAVIAENEFKAKYAVAKMATSVAGLGAATAIPMNNFKVTFNKDVAAYWIVGQNNPSDIFAQTVDITGEFQLLYTDSTYFTPRFSNTIEAIQIVLTNTDVTIGTSANPSLTLTFPQCYLNTFKVDNAIDGMVQQTVSFTATYSISAGYAAQGILTNTVNTTGY